MAEARGLIPRDATGAGYPFREDPEPALGQRRPAARAALTIRLLKSALRSRPSLVRTAGKRSPRFAHIIDL